MMAETVAQIRDRARSDALAALEVHWGERSMPVDPVRIALDMGIAVYDAVIDDDTFGMLRWESATGAAMYLDRRQPRVRHRFTCAHEVGHYVDRVSKINPETHPSIQYVDRRSDSGRGTADEVYANEFAASLLMPEKDLHELVNRGASDIELADHFDVSLQALRYRRQLVGV